MEVMTSTEFVQKAKDIATKYKTLYIMGCFGAPMNNSNKTRYCNNHSYNKQSARTNKIKKASADTFGFDCVCLIKGILWGWNGNTSKIYGGAYYTANGVPDVDAKAMLHNYCTNISTNFNNIVPGELVWMDGHIGIYIGDGLAVECTPIWKDGVQITAVGNIGKKTGYNTRTWTKHGRSKYISYITNVTTNKYTETLPTPPKRGYFMRGDRGEQVKNLQKFLNWDLGGNIGVNLGCVLVVDGIIGTQTVTQIKKFQKKYGLAQDGYFGPACFKKMKEIV